MRDTHEGMPELLAAFERDGRYFATVRVTLNSDARDIEFGLALQEYQALRRILQSRPFDQMPGLRYRYFIAYAIGRTGERSATIDIRIEQGRSGRQFFLRYRFQWLRIFTGLPSSRILQMQLIYMSLPLRRKKSNYSR